MRGVIVIAAFVLAGCASNDAPDEGNWTKAGARLGDMAVDLYVCAQWSRNPDNPREVHPPYLHQCMTAHGWQEVASQP